MDTSNYLFHGTSSLYIPYILKDGLNGKYPEELYNDLLFFWDKIPEKNSDKLTYINSFIDRQTNVRINKTISISLTTEYEVAEEYANGARNNGEGPGYMMDLIHHNKDDINPRLIMEEKKRLDELFKKFGFSPQKKTTGVILAFNIDDLSHNISNEDLRDELTPGLKSVNDHYKQYTFPIPANIINIVIPKGKGREPSKIVNITEEEAESYIGTLGSEPTIVPLEKGPIIDYLESNSTTEAEFVLQDKKYLSAFQLTPKEDKYIDKKDEFVECESNNYPNFTFFYKTEPGNSRVVNLKIIPDINPKIRGGKKLKSRLYKKYSKRKYSKRKYSKRKYSKRKYSKRKYSKRK